MDWNMWTKMAWVKENKSYEEETGLNGKILKNVALFQLVF